MFPTIWRTYLNHNILLFISNGLMFMIQRNILWFMIQSNTVPTIGTCGSE